MKGIGDGVWKPDNSGLATKSGSTNTGITGALHQPEWVVPNDGFRSLNIHHILRYCA